MPQMKTAPKVVLIALAAVVIVFGLKKATETGLIPMPGILKAVIPTKAVLPDVREGQVQNVEAVPLPSDGLARVQNTLIRGEIWEWNAQAGLIYANGGAATTDGSLMAKHNVNLLLIRQDSTDQMRDDLIACAKEIHDGAIQCSTGANFVIVMGDGSGSFLAGLNAVLAKLGPEYQAKVIGATGYSRGEDAFMAPQEVKGNPEAARGLMVAGVLRDGDWDIAQKWLGDNNVPSNPDEKTYDPNAVNWVNASDYLKAAEMYNSGACEDRRVVKDGRPTGETKHVCINGVVTWTPGDVNIAKGRGGLAKIVSSKQYRSQMPAVILGPANFFQKNREEFEGLLAATFEAGDQLKAFDQALHKAAAISAKVYNDQNEAYWYKYFKGVTESDTQGLRVELGGSSVNNMADELILFGLQPGTNDNFRSTYTVFANIVMQQYPTLFKGTPIPAAKDIEDKSFITGAQARMNAPGSEAEPVRYAQNDDAHVVSKRNYQINFNTGMATFTSSGEQTMQQLKDSLAITGLSISVVGHTDNTGNDVQNQRLSEARATAVKNWLQQRASGNFPDERFRISGRGSREPVAPNDNPEGKARNRRVEIALQGN